MKDKAEDKSNWLAVVVIKHGHPPAVYPVSKKANPHPHSVWLRKEGNLQHVDLTGTAYVKIMHQHLIGKGNLSDGTITRPRRTRYLLHDRDPAHTSKAFRAFAKNYNVHASCCHPTAQTWTHWTTACSAQRSGSWTGQWSGGACHGMSSAPSWSRPSRRPMWMQPLRTCRAESRNA